MTLNGNTLDRVEKVKLVGVCKLTIITKLKYAGVSMEDLINICILYIRSTLEYCSVLWHSTLTVEHSQSIERVNKKSENYPCLD